MKRKSTIIIEEEQDSLLQESQIKHFIGDTPKNLIKYKAHQQNINNKKIDLDSHIKLFHTSQGFFREQSDKRDKGIINILKITNMSKFPIRHSRHTSSVKSLSLSNNMTLQNSKIRSSQAKQNEFKNRKKQITSLIENKKNWAAQMLKTSIIFKMKGSVQTQSDSNFLNSSRLTSKNQKINSLKSQILKNVSNSTWMKLNPETMKQSLIFLSKDEKNERKSYFAMKQADINRQSGIRSINKIISLRKSSEKDINKRKLLQDGLISRNLSSRSLINQKIYDIKIKKIKQLQKMGIYKQSLFKESITERHDYITQTDAQYL